MLLMLKELIITMTAMPVKIIKSIEIPIINNNSFSIIRHCLTTPVLSVRSAWTLRSWWPRRRRRLNPSRRRPTPSSRNRRSSRTVSRRPRLTLNSSRWVLEVPQNQKLLQIVNEGHFNRLQMANFHCCKSLIFITGQAFSQTHFKAYLH